MNEIEEITRGGRVSCHWLLSLNQEERYKLPQSTFTVVMDDGEIRSTTERIVISSFYWVFKTHYPEVELKTSYFIGNDRLTAKHFLKLLEHVVRDVYHSSFEKRTRHYAATHELPVPSNPIDERVIMRGLSAVVMEIQNTLHNTTGLCLSEYVTGISALDYIEVNDNPNIQKAKAIIKSGESYKTAFPKAYAIATEAMKHDKSLDDNRLALLFRAGQRNIGQILKLVVGVGVVADLNDNIIPHVVKNSFAEGLNSLTDSLVESRSAAKSKFYNKKYIKMLEWANRTFQISAMVIRDIEFGDCGTTTGMMQVITAKNIPMLDGRYYINEHSRVNRINGSDQSLIGKTVLLRGPHHCNHLGHNNVCSVCYGDISLSVIDHENIGYVSTAIVGERIVQKALSNKHDTSVEINGIDAFDPVTSEFIEVGSSPTTMKFTEKITQGDWIVKFNARQSAGLADIFSADDAGKLPVFRTTAVNEIILINTTSDEEEKYILNVGNNGELSSISSMMLIHMNQVGIDWVDGNYIQFPLKGWNVEADVFELPNKGYNMLKFSAGLRTLLNFPTAYEDLKRRRELRPDDDINRVISERVAKISHYIHKHFPVMQIHIELMVAATLIRDSALPDYRLPYPNSPHRTYMKQHDLISKRGYASAVSFESIAKFYQSPGNYLPVITSSHPFDDMFFPYGPNTP